MRNDTRISILLTDCCKYIQDKIPQRDIHTHTIMSNHQRIGRRLIISEHTHEVAGFVYQFTEIKCQLHTDILRLNVVIVVIIHRISGIGIIEPVIINVNDFMIAKVVILVTHVIIGILFDIRLQEGYIIHRF